MVKWPLAVVKQTKVLQITTRHALVSLVPFPRGYLEEMGLGSIPCERRAFLPPGHLAPVTQWPEMAVSKWMRWYFWLMCKISGRWMSFKCPSHSWRPNLMFTTLLEFPVQCEDTGNYPRSQNGKILYFKLVTALHLFVCLYVSSCQ